jgi:hypothetical protein
MTTPTASSCHEPWSRPQATPSSMARPTPRTTAAGWRAQPGAQTSAITDLPPDRHPAVAIS